MTEFTKRVLKTLGNVALNTLYQLFGKAQPDKPQTPNKTRKKKGDRV